MRNYHYFTHDESPNMQIKSRLHPKTVPQFVNVQMAKHNTAGMQYIDKCQLLRMETIQRLNWKDNLTEIQV